MYTSFRARDFRCLADVRIEQPGLVNLVSGRNNVGKSSLLEALFLHAGGRNPILTLKVNAFRGMGDLTIQLAPWGENPFSWIFRNLDTGRPIVLEGEDAVRGQVKITIQTSTRKTVVPLHPPHDKLVQNWLPGQTNGSVVDEPELLAALKLKYEGGRNNEESYELLLSQRGFELAPHAPPLPVFPAYFLAARTRVPENEEAKLFSSLKKRRQEPRLLDVLKIIEPDLQDIQLLESQGRFLLHGILADMEPMPLNLMGDGMGRLATLALHVANAKGGVVLVDEVENGLHHTALTSVWKALGELAREFDTQIFATTHSLECVEAARRAFLEELGRPDDFVFYRLDKRDRDVRPVRYGCYELADALDAGFEVR